MLKWNEEWRTGDENGSDDGEGILEAIHIIQKGCTMFKYKLYLLSFSYLIHISAYFFLSFFLLILCCLLSLCVMFVFSNEIKYSFLGLLKAGRHRIQINIVISSQSVFRIDKYKWIPIQNHSNMPLKIIVG